jgi:hypothetical protein
MYGCSYRIEVKSLLTDAHSRCSSLLGSGSFSSANRNPIARGGSGCGRVMAVRNKT